MYPDLTIYSLDHFLDLTIIHLTIYLEVVDGVAGAAVGLVEAHQVRVLLHRQRHVPQRPRVLRRRGGSGICRYEARR